MIFKGGKLSGVARIDVSEAVAAVNTLLFDKVMMLKDDDNSRWAFYIKPKDEPSFCYISGERRIPTASSRQFVRGIRRKATGSAWNSV